MTTKKTKKKTKTTTTTTAALAAALLLTAAAPAMAQKVPAAQGAFEAPKSEDGVAIAEQPLQGTGLRTLRATLDIEAPPALVLETLWGKGTLEEASAAISSREILFDSPMRRVFFETVEAPFISTRESVLEVSRELDPDHGRYALVFRTIAWPQRPPTTDRVRITVVGETVVLPVAGHANQSRVVQTLFSDPGGSIPAWAVVGTQRQNMATMLKRLKAGAEARLRR